MSSTPSKDGPRDGSAGSANVDRPARASRISECGGNETLNDKNASVWPAAPRPGIYPRRGRGAASVVRVARGMTFVAMACRSAPDRG